MAWIDIRSLLCLLLLECCVLLCVFNRAYMFYVAVDDVRAEMRHLNVGPDLLSEIFKRFRDNRVKYFHILVYCILVWSFYIPISRHSVQNCILRRTIWFITYYMYLHLCLHLKTYNIPNWKILEVLEWL